MASPRSTNKNGAQAISTLHQARNAQRRSQVKTCQDARTRKGESDAAAAGDEEHQVETIFHFDEFALHSDCFLEFESDEMDGRKTVLKKDY